MATLAVTAPVAGFTGTRAGVAFRAGQGEVDADNASALAYFDRHGFAVNTPATPTKRGRSSAAPDEPVPTPPIEGDPPDA